MGLNFEGRGVVAKWVTSEGLYLAARAVMDGIDHEVQAYEAFWGPGRLRLLVGPDLRERFDRQRAKWRAAVWNGPLEALRHEGPRVLRAYQALHEAAEAMGCTPAPHEVWEVVLEPQEGQEGRVIAVARTTAMAGLLGDRYRADPRHVEVWSLEEIGGLLAASPGALVGQIKREFPGALVTRWRAPADDPVEGLGGGDLDDPIPF